MYQLIGVFGLSILLLASCRSTNRTQPTTPDDTGEVAAGPYLEEGPATRVDLGPGSMSLLEQLSESKAQLKAAEAEKEAEQKARALVEGQRDDLQGELDKKAQALKETEANLKTTGEKLHALEARLLDLAIQKAQWEEQYLQLQVQVMQERVDAKMQEASGGDATARPGR